MFGLKTCLKLKKTDRLDRDLRCHDAYSGPPGAPREVKFDGWMTNIAKTYALALGKNMKKDCFLALKCLMVPCDKLCMVPVLETINPKKMTLIWQKFPC